ncbi:MAG: hypothetical protein K9G81_01415 [Rhodobacteraceae bacterium]|nr:hypothetical protein [Paracoccaceae bacterium]
MEHAAPLGSLSMRSQYMRNSNPIQESDADPSEIDPAELDRILSGLDEDLPHYIPCQRVPVSIDDETAEVNLQAFEAIDDDEPEAVKIYDEPHVTAWDRAREKERIAEERLSRTEEGTTAHAIAKRQYDEAVKIRRIEDERDSDPEWRKRRAADVWRTGEGREEYNADRRKVREQPNMDLSGMTDVAKREHKLSQKRKRAAEAYALKKAAKLDSEAQ